MCNHVTVKGLNCVRHRRVDNRISETSLKVKHDLNRLDIVFYLNSSPLRTLTRTHVRVQIANKPMQLII